MRRRPALRLTLLVGILCVACASSPPGEQVSVGGTLPSEENEAADPSGQNAPAIATAEPGQASSGNAHLDLVEQEAQRAKTSILHGGRHQRSLAIQARIDVLTEAIGDEAPQLDVVCAALERRATEAEMAIVSHGVSLGPAHPTMRAAQARAAAIQHRRSEWCGADQAEVTRADP